MVTPPAAVADDLRRRPRIGVLALQGDVREHEQVLAACGAIPIKVRTEDDLEHIDGLVIPGGESTTMSKLAVDFGLIEPLREARASGLPMYGSCAGMIMLADRLEGGRPDQQTIGGIDMVVRRNAFGRQVDSFEADLAIPVLKGPPVHAVFIRAPWVESLGAEAEALGHVEGGPAAGRIVAVRQGDLLATSFHPELTGDHRIHELFVTLVRERVQNGTIGSQHVRPLEMGHDEAQEGSRGRPPGQALREADQEHRSGSQNRWWGSSGQPDAV